MCCPRCCLHNGRCRLHGTIALSCSLVLSPSMHCHPMHRTQCHTTGPGYVPYCSLMQVSWPISCMHTHKYAPIAALRLRVPHPRNCSPSALKAILPLHYHATPHVPLNTAHVVDLMTVNYLLVLHTVAPDDRRHPALAPAQCTSAMDLVGVADVVTPAKPPRRCVPIAVFV